MGTRTHDSDHRAKLRSARSGRYVVPKRSGRDGGAEPTRDECETGYADQSIPGSDEDFLAFIDELRRSGRRAPTQR